MEATEGGILGNIEDEVGPILAGLSGGQDPQCRAILFDYRVMGDAVWDRFNGGADGTRWYYKALADTFGDVMPSRLSDRLSRAATAFSV